MLRRYSIPLLLLFPVCSVTSASADEPAKASITVRVVDARDLEAPIVCRLFDEERWLEDEVDRASTNPAQSKVSFDGLSPGSYAVACFHDEDRDGKLTFGWFWRPKEGNGFSNGYRPLGPPKFKKAAFEVDGPTVVSVKLVYP